MRSFDQLLGLLSNIPDPRRAEGKLYKLQHVLLFSILAVATGGNSRACPFGPRAMRKRTEPQKGVSAHAGNAR